MKQPVRFSRCVDYRGAAMGDAVIDLAAVTGVTGAIAGDMAEAWTCTRITYGAGHEIYVREPLDEVLWRLKLLV